ncbi:MAG: hypothetical protein Ct9H300mP1_06940 [Planctomycetaceae bacterium]|nr:MAG: hypothetical protein Ct9H300mP1_06940 [Planctomycetaceae bacterium]
MSSPNHWNRSKWSWLEKISTRSKSRSVERFPFFASQIAQASVAQMASDDDTAPAHAAYLTSAKHFRHPRRTSSPVSQEAGFGSTVFYNEACALASKDVKKARASLAEAVELGFNDFKLLKTDKDLDPLRKAGGIRQVRCPAGSGGSQESR